MGTGMGMHMRMHMRIGTHTGIGMYMGKRVHKCTEKDSGHLFVPSLPFLFISVFLLSFVSLRFFLFSFAFFLVSFSCFFFSASFA